MLVMSKVDCPLFLNFLGQFVLQTTVTRFGPKVGQIGPKWDKSGKFSDQIQYILARQIW